jgi:hypothetical protein
VKERKLSQHIKYHVIRSVATKRSFQKPPFDLVWTIFGCLARLGLWKACNQSLADVPLPCEATTAQTTNGNWGMDS